MRNLIFFIAVALFSLSFRGDHYWSPWFFLLCSSVAVTIYSIWQRVHWSAAIAVGYTLFYGIYISFWKGSFPLVINQVRVMVLDHSSLTALFCFLMIVFPLTLLGRKDIFRFEKPFALLCILNSFLMLGQRAFGYPIGGFFGNPSMSACLTMFTYPLFVKYIDWAFLKFKISLWAWFVLMPIPLIAVLLSGSGMGVGLILIAAIYRLIFIQKEGDGDRTIYGFLSFFVIILAAYICIDKEIINDSNRLNIWKMGFDWWRANANPWFGTGVGSYTLYNVYNHFNTNVSIHNFWLWAHNDWFQLMFEQGIIGLILYVNTFFFALKAALKYDNIYLAISLILYGFTALGNFPIHYAAHALFGAWIVVACFKSGAKGIVEASKTHGGVQKV